MKKYFDLAFKLYEMAEGAGDSADFNGSSRILDVYEQQVVPKYNAALSALADLCRAVDTVYIMIRLKQGLPLYDDSPEETAPSKRENLPFEYDYPEQ